MDGNEEWEEGTEGMGMRNGKRVPRRRIDITPVTFSDDPEMWTGLEGGR